jgi:hypothetical protein
VGLSIEVRLDSNLINLMEKDLKCILMGLSMKASLVMDTLMDLVEVSHLKEKSFKVTLTMIRWMVLASSNGQMVECMKENGNQARKWGKVSFIGPMDRFMKVSLKTMNVVAMVNFTIQMEKYLKAFGKMARNMVNVYMYGLMEPDTMCSI